MPEQKLVPQLKLVLGYDPLDPNVRNANGAARQQKGSEQRKGSRPSSAQTDAARSRTLSSRSSSSSGASQRHPMRSLNSIASTSRSSSRHPPMPIPEQPGLRDSISEDPFYQAYFEPGLKKLSDDWQHRLIREHESERVVRNSGAPSGFRARTFTRKLSLRAKAIDPHMPVLHVRVIGHRDVLRASFIKSALGQPQDKSAVNNEYLEQIRMDGQNILVRVTERVLEPGVLKDIEALSEWGKSWDQSPDRVDGAIVLYDVTNTATIEGLPTALRSYSNAAIPNILVTTGHDSGRSVLINQEIFNKKADIWNKGNKDRMVFQASLKDGSSQSCLHSLLRDILQSQSEEDRLATTSRPGTASSSQRAEGSVPSLVKHGRTGSGYSASSSKGQDPAVDSIPPPSPTPRPKLAAQAARQNNTSDGDLKSGGGGSQQQARRESSVLDGFDSDTALNEDIDDDRDAAILTTQQTYGQNVATFDELVDRLIRPFQEAADAKFVDRFLAFYRMFSSSQRLLEAIISRCLKSASSSTPIDESQYEQIEHAFRVLSVWIKRYPGDFALEKTADTLDAFLQDFESRDASFLTENIRIALQDVEETDDTGWGVLDDSNAAGASSSSVTLGSSHSSNRPTSPPRSSRGSRAASVLVDDSYIFKTGALTLNAMGPSSDRASLTSARTKEKISEQAQRKAVLLVPNPRMELTKDRWRHLLEIPELDIAEELTRIDWIMFSSIKPRDLIRDVTVSLSKRERYVDLANVSRMIDHFNHVAYWTTNLILLRDKPKHRAQMWLKLARVARKLRELNNYNALGAIVAGMEGTSIHRLAATKALVSDADQRDFIKIQLLMSTSRGHFSYRMAWDNTSGPRLPFLPLHRRDLVVAEQGNKSMVARTTAEGKAIKLVNWTKFDIMGSILTDFQRAQTTTPRSFRGSDTVRALLLNCTIRKDDDELYDRSVALEPPQQASSTLSKGPGAAARRRLQPWLVRYGLTQA